MRVGIVMPLGEFRGGVERMLMNLLTANSDGPRVEYSVAFMEHGPLTDAVREAGYDATTVPAGRLRDPLAYVRAARGFGRWMDAVKPDAVLSWAAKGHLYAGGPARRRGIPAAWYVHAIPDGHWMDRLTTAMPADLVLCCSRAAEDAQRTLRPARPTRTINISVDLSTFDPAALPTPPAARGLLGLPPSGPIVLMVARLQRWKGVHVFVDAAAALAETYPDATFIVVGGEHPMEPGYGQEIEEQVASLGLSDRVRLVGLQHNVPVWMQSADVIVHASFDEPAGAVVLEGMALGKAVVASRSAGPMEFLRDREHGRLATPGNAAELASVIADLLDDENERRRLGAAARLRASDFGSDRFASQIADAMRSIVAGWKGGAPE